MLSPVIIGVEGDDFKYAYKDEGMYMVFAAVLAVAQLTALSVFPLFRKKFTRKQQAELISWLAAALKNGISRKSMTTQVSKYSIQQAVKVLLTAV